MKDIHVLLATGGPAGGAQVLAAAVTSPRSKCRPWKLLDHMLVKSAALGGAAGAAGVGRG